MIIGIVLSKPPAYSETFFVNKIKGLQKSGHKVILFVQDSPSNFSLCQVIRAPKIYKLKVRLVISIIQTYLSLLFHVKRLITFIKLEKKANRRWSQIFKNIYFNAHLLKSNLDWIHFGFATMALQRENIAKTIGAKMAVSLRGFDIAIYPFKNKGCYNLLWKKVDKVHTISDDLLQIAYKLGLAKETACKKITPAINTSLFIKNDSPAKKQSDFIQFLTVARLHWKKGLIETLEALAILKYSGLNFSYKIIGEGEMYEELLFTIDQLNLTKEVFLLGRLEQHQVAQYYKSSNIYLQYSLSEGFCNAVIEAQASGCLCLVSDAEGLSENVLNEQTGWVVEKGQPKLLAKKIKEVICLADEDKEKMSSLAVAHVKKNFALEDQQSNFFDFYNS